jgi:hypothetical protein
MVGLTTERDGSMLAGAHAAREIRMLAAMIGYMEVRPAVVHPGAPTTLTLWSRVPG